MTTYNDRNKLAARAEAVFGTEEAQTLMDMLSTGERVELQIVQLRAELDQRFAQIDQRFAQVDQRFVDLQRAILDGIDAKLTNATRFGRTTVWGAAISIATAIVASGIAIAIAIAIN